MMNNGNPRGATDGFYNRSLRELYKTGLRLTQQNRHMLQVLRASLQPGSDERATVVREIRRYIRLERAAQNVIDGPVSTVDDMLISVAELNSALIAIQVSPDADLIGDFLQQVLQAAGMG
jgi:MinD superfamily P-loop ATPase